MWTELTTTNLQTRLSEVELDALTAELADPTDKLAEILLQTAQEIISRVNTGRRKRGLVAVAVSGPYVPPGAVRHAYTIARQLLTDSFPALAAYNGDDRKAAMESAEKYLSDLANNNADSDDAGAEDYEPTPPSGETFGFQSTGKPLLDFVQF